MSVKGVLLEQFNAAFDRSGWLACLHNAYHGGQIVLLQKLQGSWAAGKGVS